MAWRWPPRLSRCRPSARRVCLAAAVGVSSGPGRRAAQSPSRTGRTIERARVVGRIRRHSGEVSIHLVDQTDPRNRVIGRRLSQRAGHDHTGPVHAERELPPAASPSAPMFRRGPLTFADDGQSGAVNDEVQAGARAGAPKREGEMLTASRERGVIGCREIDAQHPEDRGQEALGLTQRSVEEETERQGGFDGEIGILELPAPPADASRCPRGDRVRREPEGDVASPHEGSVVLGPVPDAIRCRVLRMHSRLHIEIMTRRRSRWSTCRPLLAHRAESAHQRHAATPTARWSSTATGSRSAAGARRGAPLARRPGCQPASSTIAGAYDTAASAFAGAVRADHRSRRSASRISPTVRRHQRRAVDAVCRGARRHLPPLPG